MVNKKFFLILTFLITLATLVSYIYFEFFNVNIDKADYFTTDLYSEDFIDSVTIFKKKYNISDEAKVIYLEIMYTEKGDILSLDCNIEEPYIFGVKSYTIKKFISPSSDEDKELVKRMYGERANSMFGYQILINNHKQNKDFDKFLTFTNFLNRIKTKDFNLLKNISNKGNNYISWQYKKPIEITDFIWDNKGLNKINNIDMLNEYWCFRYNGDRERKSSKLNIKNIYLMK